MKRYQLFGGDIYYASGGWADFIGDFDTVGEAIARAGKPVKDERLSKEIVEWWHVVDSAVVEPVIVAQSDDQPY